MHGTIFSLIDDLHQVDMNMSQSDWVTKWWQFEVVKRWHLALIESFFRVSQITQKARSYIRSFSFAATACAIRQQFGIFCRFLLQKRENWTNREPKFPSKTWLVWLKTYCGYIIKVSSICKNCYSLSHSKKNLYVYIINQGSNNS